MGEEKGGFLIFEYHMNMSGDGVDERKCRRTTDILQGFVMKNRHRKFLKGIDQKALERKGKMEKVGAYEK